MRNLLLAALALLGLAPSTAALAADTTSSLSIAEKGFGFHGAPTKWGYTDAQWQQYYSDMHANLTRISLQWDSIETTPGVFDWTSADAWVAASTAVGARPIIVVWAAPPWARDTIDSSCVDNSLFDCRYPPADSRSASWQAFVGQVVQRYGAAAAAIEVWNEPNFMWRASTDPSDPERYTRLLCWAHAEVKRLQPTLPVLFGGLSPGGKNVPPKDYWQRALAAGATQCFDAMGVHPYPLRAPDNNPSSAAWDTLAQLDEVRATLTAAGRSGAPLWVTEWGYSTYIDSDGTTPGNDGHFDGVTEADQATFMARGLRLLMEQPDVHAVIIHRLQDGGSNRTNVEHNFGLVRQDATRKPSYPALVEERNAQVSSP